MPIIQISKIQQRSGNLVDLPQLDNAQFGWAYDQNRLFIGRSGESVTSENIEVLTAYSNLSFSQVDGSAGSNIYVTSPETGQVLAYDSTLGAFINAGGNATSNINLGNVSNVSLGGGAIGYVLETDGFGSLSWTPKTTIVANIASLTNSTSLPDGSPGNIIIMTVPNSTPYVNAAQVTIAGVAGTNANAIVNSQVFYVKVSNNYPSTGQVYLYTNSILSTPANGVNLTATANTGTATTAVVNTGITYAAGSNTSIQYNNGGFIDGSANLSIVGSNLTLTGNFLVSNVSASGSVVASTITGSLLTNAQPNITSVGTLSSLTVTANVTGGNLITGGVVSATGNITGGNLITGGVVSATGNANVGNIGATTAILTTGNITTINSGLMQNGTSNVVIVNNANVAVSSAGNANIIVITGTGANIAGTVSATGNANVANLGATGVFSTTVSATGNANIGNIGTGGLITATGNVTGGNLISTTYTVQSVLAGQTANGTNQATALAITKSIIELTTVLPSTGVVLPTAVAGMTITVINNGLNALNVYPASSASINSLSSNVAYSLPISARLQFIALSTTKWYTLNATYA